MSSIQLVILSKAGASRPPMALGKALKEGDFGRSGVNVLNTREGDAGRQERDCEGLEQEAAPLQKGMPDPR